MSREATAWVVAHGIAGRPAQSGQATLEHVGITLVIALLMAAVGTWTVREFRPPDAPPAVIEHVAAPLFGSVPEVPSGTAARMRSGLMRVTPGFREFAREQAAAGDPGLIRRLWDGFLWWGALNVDGQIEAGRGFLEQVGVRAEDLVKDPVKTIGGAVERLSKPPVTGTAERVGRIVDTVTTAGERPFRDSFLGVSRDLGGIGADWLISKFARWGGAVLGRIFP